MPLDRFNAKPLRGFLGLYGVASIDLKDPLDQECRAEAAKFPLFFLRAMLSVQLNGGVQGRL